jgi:hypothetical protein
MLTHLRHILVARLWERQNVPLLTPQISFDVLLFAAVSRLEQKELPVKTFHLALGYSEDRTREVIQALETGGWLLIRSSELDKRSKNIIATDKTLETLLQYVQLLSCGLSDVPDDDAALNGGRDAVQAPAEDRRPPVGFEAI